MTRQEPPPTDAGGVGPDLRCFLFTPSSRAKSCHACRKSKVKCRGPPNGPSFPCARCKRLNLPCHDPQSIESSRYPGKMLNMVKMMSKRLQSPPVIERKCASRLLSLFSLTYRRQVLSGRAQPDSAMASTLQDLMRVLADYLGYEFTDYTAKLTASLEGGEAEETGVVIDGVRYSFVEGESAAAALHPYCAALTHECRATLSVINIRGEERFVANKAFAATFFHQDEANRLLSQEHVPPPAIISLTLHPDEKPRYYRSIKAMMLESEAERSEEVQIYKVRLAKLGVTVMALMRSRLVLLFDGVYLAATHSLTPLPMPAAPSGKKCPSGGDARRIPLQFPAEHDPWLECAKRFGDWDDAHTTGPTATDASATTTTTSGGKSSSRKPSGGRKPDRRHKVETDDEDEEEEENDEDEEEGDEEHENAEGAAAMKKPQQRQQPMVMIKEEEEHRPRKMPKGLACPPSEAGRPHSPPRPLPLAMASSSGSSLPGKRRLGACGGSEEEEEEEQQQQQQAGVVEELPRPASRRSAGETAGLTMGQWAECSETLLGVPGGSIGWAGGYQQQEQQQQEAEKLHYRPPIQILHHDYQAQHHQRPPPPPPPPQQQLHRSSVHLLPPPAHSGGDSLAAAAMSYPADHMAPLQLHFHQHHHLLHLSGGHGVIAEPPGGFKDEDLILLQEILDVPAASQQQQQQQPPPPSIANQSVLHQYPSQQPQSAVMRRPPPGYHHPSHYHQHP